MTNLKNGTVARGASAGSRLRFLVLCLLTLLLLSCQQKADTPEAIVKKVIAAHGGAEKLRAVNGYLYLGQIQAAMADDQGKVWILYREPEQLRVIIRMSEGKEERLLLGDEGWRDNGRGFVKVDGPALAVMAFQAEHIDLPRHLVEKRYKVKKAEIQNEEKGETLILTDADGVETVVVVDPVRSVIRTVEREFDIAGQTVRMGVAYEDYRDVKGVQLPFRLLNFVNGQLVGRTDYQSVQINPPLPERVFERPE